MNTAYISLVLSSIAILWNVYKEVRSRTGNLKFHYDEEFVNDNATGILGNYAFISIVNSSEKSRTIRKIQVDRFVGRKEIFEVLDEDIPLPIKLDTGDQFKYRLFSLDKENKYMSHDYTDLKDDSIPDDEKYLTTTYYTPSKMRIRLTDTMGKRYKSKWIDVKIIDCIPDYINT
jgi:hypothetical protein